MNRSTLTAMAALALMGIGPANAQTFTVTILPAPDMPLDTVTVPDLDKYTPEGLFLDCFRLVKTTDDPSIVPGLDDEGKARIDASISRCKTKLDAAAAELATVKTSYFCPAKYKRNTHYLSAMEYGLWFAETTRRFPHIPRSITADKAAMMSVEINNLGPC